MATAATGTRTIAADKIKTEEHAEIIEETARSKKSTRRLKIFMSRNLPPQKSLKMSKEPQRELMRIVIGVPERSRRVRNSNKIFPNKKKGNK